MLKVKHVVRTAAEVMKMGKCVVIGLQSTGEARTIEAVEREEELTDFVSTSKGVLQASVVKVYQSWTIFRSRPFRLDIFKVDISVTLEVIVVSKESKQPLRSILTMDLSCTEVEVFMENGVRGRAQTVGANSQPFFLLFSINLHS